MLFGDKCATEERNMEMCLFTRPVLLFNSDIFTILIAWIWNLWKTSPFYSFKALQVLQQNESFSILLNTTEEVKGFFVWLVVFFLVLVFYQNNLRKKHMDKKNLRQDYSVTVTVVGGD